MRRHVALLLGSLLALLGPLDATDVSPELAFDTGEAFLPTNKVKWPSAVQPADHPSFALVRNESNLAPVTSRGARRKRCSCGCAGCDLFPNRACCQPNCCSGAPLPLACCPPPPPPKPCCQPNFGPCCPATRNANCCRKPCCKGRRPPIYDEEEEYPTETPPSQPPVPPPASRTCCPPAVPPAPPPAPPPPPPPPEPPVECCADKYPRPSSGRRPCGGGCSGPGCCGRPCCFYKDPVCCQSQKPCCPPPPPPLPCCPALPAPTTCCNVVPPCLRGCPTCPCRKRIFLGTRAKRQSGHDGFHCQACPTLSSAKAQGIRTAVRTRGHQESAGVAEKAPQARGGLFAANRQPRVKREGCQLCLNGNPIVSKTRQKRSFDCVLCTYLQPTYNSSPNALAYGVSANSVRRSPVPIPVDPAHRVKRQGCLPYPQCTQLKKRSKRTIGSQYCEPCPGGLHGRKKREAARDTCLKRQKRAYESEESSEGTRCKNDDEDEEEESFSLTRMKRQAYNPSGILDIVKVLSRMSSGGARSPGGCMKFPACVLAKKRRRKRHAARLEKYHEAVGRHKEELVRHKRQFYAPDQAANCVPCPAWVTLALASRTKREVEPKSEDHTQSLSFADAVHDIRRRQRTRSYEREDCEQTEDCMNDDDYNEFMRIYSRKKRQSFLSPHRREKRCVQCSGSDRVKRSFGGPNINASAQSCSAFPACRHRVKRDGFDCNICTPNANPLKKSRRKRNFGTAQCYPCPNSG
ncbi:hypothetical protein QR680_009310 [Steinernema hermaphroditum]|uniref:Uncharacterized protein n=1 Tax=Steinernema hermaphroditum TaxID=289476 RepID=A0AA39IJT6_9BILA|nr:hypothetical protein QR680_009310 [Steinernema hermaphroditum]